MSDAALAGPARLPSAAPFFQRLVAMLVARLEARRTYRALSDLSDRELEDIGLCRGDIRAAAYGTR